MPFIFVIISLVVIGVVLLTVNTYVPMDPTIKKILNVIVAILLIAWLLSAFGILPSGS